MRPVVSEIGYSHAVYGELLTEIPCASAPYMPTANDEALVPYDLEWPCTILKSLFIQFKVSDYLIGTGSAERPDIVGPYFRFSLHRSFKTCTQHNLLKQLAHDFPGDVHYVAPLFWEYSDFLSYWPLKQILDHTTFLSLDNFSTFTDSDWHRVAFNHSEYWEFSAGRKIGTVVTGRQFVDALKRELPDSSKLERQTRTARRSKKNKPADQPLKLLLRDQLKDLLGTLIQILSEQEFEFETPNMNRWSDAALDSEIYRLAATIQSLARTYFDLAWLAIPDVAPNS